MPLLAGQQYDEVFGDEGKAQEAGEGDETGETEELAEDGSRPTPAPSREGGERLRRVFFIQSGGLPSLTGSEGNIGLTKCQAVLSDRSRTPLLRTGKVGGGFAGAFGGGSPEDSSPIPPEKQALADIYLAEVALQVAYRKQAAEEAVRAYQAGITGEETQQPIIAF
jgi:hypothetical protein